MSATAAMADDQTTILASRAGGRQFEHVGLGDGDEVDLGGLGVTALATPGHTDEHVSFLLRDGERPVGVFTGGSLIVGSAARTDLLGAARAEELTRAQFASLRRLSALPTETAVWPTQGGWVLLLRAAGCGANLDDRPGAGDQPAAEPAGRGPVRSATTRVAGQLSAVLPATRTAQPKRAARPRSRPRWAPAWIDPRRGAPAGRDRRGRRGRPSDA
jgi:hypothetical protein